jgi:hypothetical protein
MSGDAQLMPLLDIHKHEAFVRPCYQIQQSRPLATLRNQSLVCRVNSFSISDNILPLVFILCDRR